MTTIVLLVVVAGLIGGFSYVTNAGFGDRRPAKKQTEKKPNDGQASAADEETPPPSR